MVNSELEHSASLKCHRRSTRYLRTFHLSAAVQATRWFSTLPVICSLLAGTTKDNLELDRRMTHRALWKLTAIRSSKKSRVVGTLRLESQSMTAYLCGDPTAKTNSGSQAEITKCSSNQSSLSCRWTRKRPTSSLACVTLSSYQLPIKFSSSVQWDISKAWSIKQSTTIPLNIFW